MSSLPKCLRGQENRTAKLALTVSPPIAAGTALGSFETDVAVFGHVCVAPRPVAVVARHCCLMVWVPGRKTDVSDCQWIAQLLQHGLLSPSFVPPRPQGELRDLTRQRTKLVGDRVRVIARIQKTLENANLKLASVATDITGKSGRMMVDALAEGWLTPEQMAQMAHRRMRAKIPQLEETLLGRVTAHHRFMPRQLLEQMDHIDRQIDSFDARIEEVMSPLEKASVERLDEIPGFDSRTRQNVIAEIGTDMNRFPSAKHLASWAGMCPGNNESAGKRRTGRTNQANRWLKSALVQAAWPRSRTRSSYYDTATSVASDTSSSLSDEGRSRAID